MVNLVVSEEPSAVKSESGQTPTSPGRNHLRRKRWIVGITFLSLLLILATDALYRFLEGQPGPVTHLTGSGEAIQLNSARQIQFAGMVREEIRNVKVGATSQIAEQIERRIDASFDQLQQGVDGYLEWYFSAQGSYSRLYVAITGDLAEWGANKIRERLMDESGYTDSIESLANEYPDIQNRIFLNELDRFQVMVDDYLNTYGAEIEMNSVNPDIPFMDFTNITQGPGVALELDRLATSASIGQNAAIGGFAVALVRYGGVKAARLFVRQFIARAAAQGARAAVTGATTAAATAFTGPFAVGAGVLTASASAAAFVTTEYIALNAQETLHRPKMEQDIREFIELKRDETKMAYRLASGVAVDRILESILADIAEREEQQKLDKCYRVFSGADC